MRAALPNLLTASRGLAGFVVLWLLVAHQANVAAMAVMIGAVSTDLVDGWLARKLGATSMLGEWLDPLSDKVLTDTTWVGLWAIGWTPGWMVGTLLFRDVVVAVGYAIARRRGRTFRANLTGRLMVTFEGIALAVLVFHGPWLGVHWPSVGVALGVLALALSVVSALEYVAVGPAPPDPSPR